MAAFGTSTLGVLFGYACESTAGTKPSAFNLLTRISSIGEITLDSETIDVSALEDYESKYVDGRATATDKVEVVVNMTDDTIKEWEDAMTEYAALTGGKQMWFEVYSPYLTKAFFFKGSLPKRINMPAQEQNASQTFTVSIVMKSLEDMANGIKPLPKSNDGE